MIWKEWERESLSPVVLTNVHADSDDSHLALPPAILFMSVS